MAIYIRRREFVLRWAARQRVAAGGAGAAARADAAHRYTRGRRAEDPTFGPAHTFLQALAQLGWTDGRNVRIDARWPTGNADNIRKHAAELGRSSRT